MQPGCPVRIDCAWGAFFLPLPLECLGCRGGKSGLPNSASRGSCFFWTPGPNPGTQWQQH